MREATALRNVSAPAQNTRIAALGHGRASRYSSRNTLPERSLIGTNISDAWFKQRWFKHDLAAAYRAARSARKKPREQLLRGDSMPVTKVEVERFNLVSSKPFDAVVGALKANVGRLNVAELSKTSKTATSFSELEKMITRNPGPNGLMLFEELDHGAVLRRESGLDEPRILRLLIGNPLIMKEMAKHVPDAGSYAPTTVLVDERADGVHLSYDRMASFLAPYENAKALAVARELDAKVEKLLQESAA